MKNFIKEDIKLDKFKFSKIDPHNEEDWDEFEIKNGDIFYFWGIDNNTPYVGIGESKLVNNNFKLKVINSTCEKLKNITIDFTDRTKKQIDTNQFSNIKNHLFENNYIVSLVTDKKFLKYYKDIHESIRFNLLEIKKNINTKYYDLDNQMDKLESDVIGLKKMIKEKNDFPPANQLSLNENEYIVIKVHNNTPNIYLTKLEKIKDKEGYNLIDIETDEKIIYLKNTYKRLIENNYLLLKSKNNKNLETYITNDIENYYEEFIKKIITDTNKSIEEKIDEYRKLYNEKLEKLNDLRDKIEIFRKDYMNFKFSNLVDELKKMI